MNVDTSSPKPDKKTLEEISIPPFEAIVRLYAKIYQLGTLEDKGAADYYIHHQFLTHECPPALAEQMLCIYETEKNLSLDSPSQSPRLALA